MNRAWSVVERVKRARRLLDLLAPEAPELQAMHVALTVDEARDVLLPVLASDTRAADAGPAATSEGGTSATHGDRSAEEHWVLMALPVHGGHGAPLGCFYTLEVAKAAAETWCGSPLSWTWLDAARSAGFPWNLSRWFAETVVTRPEDIFDRDEVYLLIYPLPAPAGTSA